jgi:hypothetical protein
MRARDEIGLASRAKAWPVHGWFGLGLVITSWTLNWPLSGLRSHWTFFPLWLGYCLTVDALVLARKGTSLLTRNPRAYVGLFLVLAPAWWLFELLNWRNQNWLYGGRQFFTNLQYLVLASFSLSTVMPAVFRTAELVSTLDWIKRSKRGRVVIWLQARSIQQSVRTTFKSCLSARLCLNTGPRSYSYTGPRRQAESAKVLCGKAKRE